VGAGHGEEAERSETKQGKGARIQN
jgi:hypothetical protein